MRPQHDAAENLPFDHLSVAARAASMRPQHDAAENAQKDVNVTTKVTRFNEAAA